MGARRVARAAWAGPRRAGVRRGPGGATACGRARESPACAREARERAPREGPRHALPHGALESDYPYQCAAGLRGSSNPRKQISSLCGGLLVLEFVHDLRLQALRQRLAGGVGGGQPRLVEAAEGALALDRRGAVWVKGGVLGGGRSSGQEGRKTCSIQYRSQCPRTDLNKRFLPRPKTTTA